MTIHGSTEMQLELCTIKTISGHMTSDQSHASKTMH